MVCKFHRKEKSTSRKDVLYFWDQALHTQSLYILKNWINTFLRKMHMYTSEFLDLKQKDFAFKQCSFLHHIFYCELLQKGKKINKSIVIMLCAKWMQTTSSPNFGPWEFERVLFLLVFNVVMWHQRQATTHSMIKTLLGGEAQVHILITVLVLRKEITQLDYVFLFR